MSRNTGAAPVAPAVAPACTAAPRAPRARDACHGSPAEYDKHVPVKKGGPRMASRRLATTRRQVTTRC
eukprot:358198-Chlamydomonas_euryale.AAC.2